MTGALHPNDRSNWTEDRMAMLKSLWGDGLSASQIASELGGVTRNGVIGKLHRLGLSKTYTPRTEARQANPKPKRKRSRNPQYKKPPTPTALEVAEENYRAAIEATELPPEVSPFACTLVDLNENTCRWPYGDPATEEFRFCGAKPLEGLPYCGPHARQAYQPAQRLTPEERQARAQQARTRLRKENGLTSTEQEAHRG